MFGDTFDISISVSSCRFGLSCYCDLYSHGSRVTCTGVFFFVVVGGAFTVLKLAEAL